MSSTARRIAALEKTNKLAGNGQVVAFMVDGASDDDVISINGLRQTVYRQPGETLAAMVSRAKAQDPSAKHHVLFFEYSDAVMARLDCKHMPESLPNSWPIPSPAGHACHLEARS